MIQAEEFKKLKTNKDLLDLLKERIDEDPLYKKVLDSWQYEKELKLLQSELIKLQQWIVKEKKKVLVILEGRDAAGKGGTIRRFTEHLNPRATKTVALNKPTVIEQGQWYFRRYIKELPNVGDIAFFDRSWYNRAVVEPIMGFCTPKQYEIFMAQVPEFEHMLYEDNVNIIKFWFSISKEVQLERFQNRLKNPLKQWKYSPVDAKGQELWDNYTYYKNQMMSRTHTTFSPWVIVKADNKKRARLESIRYLLSKFEYDGKELAEVELMPDPNIVHHYFRLIKQID